MGQLEFMIKQFCADSKASSPNEFSSERKIQGLEIFEKIVVFCIHVVQSIEYATHASERVGL